MIFIPYNVPSSKNSRVWTGKFLVKSKACRKYEKLSKPYYQEYAEQFYQVVKDLTEKDKSPVEIGFHFVRGTKHKYDWVNPVQTVQDIMVDHGWLDDDNINIMVPKPFKINGAFSSYDKENPGVYIKILSPKK